MELVRAIMLTLETDLRGQVEGYSDDAIKYHKALLIDDGLVEGMVGYPSYTVPTDIPHRVSIRRITSKGHDFIDAIRTEGKWNKIKSFLASAGKDLTLETIKYAAKQLFGIIDSST